MSQNTNPSTRAHIQRLIGVYNADGTMRGELSYWVGARLGRAHCALCDITHGSVRERPDWKACRTGLPVPFDTYHRDDQPEPVKQFIGKRLPAVVAETNEGLVMLLDPDDLDRCVGSVEHLADALTAAATRFDLDWP